MTAIDVAFRNGGCAWGRSPRAFVGGDAGRECCQVDEAAHVGGEEYRGDGGWRSPMDTTADDGGDSCGGGTNSDDRTGGDWGTEEGDRAFEVLDSMERTVDAGLCTLRNVLTWAMAG